MPVAMGCCRWCVWTLVVVAAGLAFLVYLYDLSSPETPTMSTTPSSAPEPLKPWESNYLLPDSIRPLTYDILLHPELASGQFTGRVRITINISQAMGYCLLNADGLTIDDTRLRMADGVPIRLNKTFNYRPSQYWVIVPQDTLLPGSYQVEVDFRGSLIGKIEGFYLSSYRPNSNSSVTRSIATTKFEPTYARRAFPCFDEPSFKAKYIVSIVRPSEGNYIALSNMNQESEIVDSPSQGLTTVKFATSVPMSTYLACFIVCDFDQLPSKKSKHGFDVTVYARNGQITKMDYALQLAASVVEFYIDYFSINYPLPKLDLIAIPDFVSGAMENWGLITFRETSVLYDPKFTTGLNHLGVTLTISHELAHMWFGNLVTMKWWDDLWLNEGFASFVAFKGSAHVHPDWDMDTLFLWHYLTDALSLDSTLSSHPIIKHVSHPDQITEIFDHISYSKGASVLRMMEAFLGEENFRQGVVSYLKTFAYNNAETKDLWHHLQEFSPEVNVARVMDTWTRQMGLPVLVVTQDGDTITVTQKRFTTDINASYDPNESPFKYIWDVPVTYITSENRESTLKWLLLEDSSLKIKIGDVKWYKLNWHFMGYYRVLYPSEHWHALTKILLEDIKALDAADRANIVDDAFALAESGNLDYSIALSLTAFLEQEDHFVVWAHAADRLLSMDKKLETTPIFSDFRNYLKKLITPRLKDSLWDFSGDTSILQRAVQARLISLACKLEIPEYLSKAKQLFLDWLENNGPKPHVEIQNTVYYYGIAESGEDQWNKLWDRFVAESDPQEKVRMRSALCATKNDKIVKRLIELAKDSHYIRSQDYFNVLQSIAYNPKANPIVWDWIRTNWNYLVDRFTLNNRSLGKLLPEVVGTYSTEEKLKEVEQFLADNPEEGAGASSRKSAIESIKLNILWLKKHIPTLTAWLKTV